MKMGTVLIAILVVAAILIALFYFKYKPTKLRGPSNEGQEVQEPLPTSEEQAIQQIEEELNEALENMTMEDVEQALTS